jgi:hypothetical protein
MFEDLIGRVACRFTRVEPRRRVRALLEGLLAELRRKSCWPLAEYAGDAPRTARLHPVASLSTRSASTGDETRARRTFTAAARAVATTAPKELLKKSWVSHAP